ncbi:MAG: glutamine-hydrolyzing GMP synthase subunit GuaA [candidate division WOR-3 bacterium]|nr:MAG: glutamine-hydrolyzing GMP synthase subunit GuaA [candidate division WOR-3 bacterium]
MAFNAQNFVVEKTRDIRSQVGNDTTLCATSGGVDSMVCAFLAHRALGRNLIAIFIDDGLMREGEPEKVTSLLRSRGIRTVLVLAADDFFKALKGKEDPEDMRKAFRDTFYKTLGKAVRKHRAKYLIQGTIAADVIETKGKIKSQHNVLAQIGINPRRYGLNVIEPLVTLFKPDVRKVGKALRLPSTIHQRMPFPGPGLATRVVGEVTPAKVRLLRKATSIVEREMKSIKAFQTFAVLLDDRATGVRKGKRSFGNIIVVRSVQSKNAMTATPTRVPYDVLERIQKKITNQIPEVTKVLYDISPKPPSTIEYI